MFYINKNDSIFWEHSVRICHHHSLCGSQHSDGSLSAHSAFLPGNWWCWQPLKWRCSLCLITWRSRLQRDRQKPNNRSWTTPPWKIWTKAHRIWWSITSTPVNKKARRTYALTDSIDKDVSVPQGSLQVIRSQGEEQMSVGYGSMPGFNEFKELDPRKTTWQQYSWNQCLLNVQFSLEDIPFSILVSVVSHTTAYIADLHMNWNGARIFDNWIIYSIPRGLNCFIRRAPADT